MEIACMLLDSMNRQVTKLKNMALTQLVQIQTILVTYHHMLVQVASVGWVEVLHLPIKLSLTPENSKI